MASYFGLIYLIYALAYTWKRIIFSIFYCSQNSTTSNMGMIKDPDFTVTFKKI
jgi:hypothetical protein